MKKFIENLQEILEMEEIIINPSDKFRDYEDWDSLALLSVQAMINNKYNITIDRDSYEKAITVGDLYKLVQEKL